MNDNKMEYQTPQFMPMTDFELQSVNGGGIPVVVFILVAAVTVVELSLIHISLSKKQKFRLIIVKMHKKRKKDI